MARAMHARALAFAHARAHARMHMLACNVSLSRSEANARQLKCIVKFFLGTMCEGNFDVSPSSALCVTMRRLRSMVHVRTCVPMALWERDSREGARVHWLTGTLQ